MRTFISVELPEAVRKKVAELINGLKDTGAAVKWVEAGNLHITLKFLGWVEDRDLDNLTALTAQAVSGKGSFRARFKGVGTFPDGRDPRVVWVGTAEGGDGLCELAKSLEETLSKAGFRREEREFRPHITAGRVKEKKGVDRLKAKIQSQVNAEFGETLVDRVHIMKSTLTPKGPVYEKVKEVML